MHIVCIILYSYITCIFDMEFNGFVVRFIRFIWNRFQIRTQYKKYVVYQTNDGFIFRERFYVFNFKCIQTHYSHSHRATKETDFGTHILNFFYLLSFYCKFDFDMKHFQWKFNQLNLLLWMKPYRHIDQLC